MQISFAELRGFPRIRHGTSIVYSRWSLVSHQPAILETPLLNPTNRCNWLFWGAPPFFGDPQKHHLNGWNGLIFRRSHASHRQVRGLLWKHPQGGSSKCLAATWRPKWPNWGVSRKGFPRANWFSSWKIHL
jgi:hypothetical protein